MKKSALGIAIAALLIIGFTSSRELRASRRPASTNKFSDGTRVEAIDFEAAGGEFAIFQIKEPGGKTCYGNSSLSQLACTR